ncbi:hypothetical protein CBL_20762 [Carabus blaptoides fortunei]
MFTPSTILHQVLSNKRRNSVHVNSRTDIQRFLNEQRHREKCLKIKQYILLAQEIEYITISKQQWTTQQNHY